VMFIFSWSFASPRLAFFLLDKPSCLLETFLCRTWRKSPNVL